MLLPGAELKTAANSRRRTSFGRKLETTSDGIQATHAAGDITNLVHEASAALEGGSWIDARSCMQVMLCLGSTRKSRSVNILNQSIQKRSSKRCKSDSFVAVQSYVSENANAAKGKLATIATKTSLTSPLVTTRLACSP